MAATRVFALICVTILVHTAPAARAQTATAPALPQQANREVQIDGQIDVLIEDHPGRSVARHFITSNGSRREVRFTGERRPFTSGDRVRVRGVVQPDGALQLNSDGSSVQSLAAAPRSTTGAQSIVVLLVNFQNDQRQPYTAADAESVMTQVGTHYWLGSYEQVTITSQIVGWLTVAHDPTVCDPSTIARLADEAATNAGVDVAAYGRRIYAFPQLAACSWWGLGSVGGSPSQAWINGTFAKKVVGHELGHNFGLYHANAHDCGAAPIGPTCSDLEYGNTIDIMGNPSSGNFNLLAKEQLGWVNAGVSPPLTVVTESAAYAIPPYEALDARSKGLRILRSIDAAGVPSYYYVEFRQPVGNDAFLLNNANVTSGVVISLGSGADNNWLLDMTPETASWSDPALAVGRRFVDPDTGLRIETLAADSSGATVMVTMAAAIAPTATVVLNTTSPRTGDTLVARASAFDANGDAVRLTYAWSVNGVTKRVTATTNLSDTFNLGVIGQGDPGDVIVVGVTPFDGSLTGKTVSASAMVQRKRR